ncbi:hypothetical protein CAL20_13275 [Bordetella genomosp. 4]|uniref:Glycosyltransferase 2-like domain-containing protein n=2 Tax=Bordetella genomosp. 4 TaxID=463044 RepID=A0A261U4Z7_9BORD|nr:hypothetical protein CAL20_13275 [Bordetella genomosp. 4]
MNGQMVDVDVLVTRRGQIQEMVKVPAGIQALRVNPSSDLTTPGNISLSLRRLSWLEYRFRQLRRILPVFFRQPKQRRARAGLELHTVFTNLSHAYAVSCRFRANAYMRSYADWHAEFYSVSPDDRHLILKHLREWGQFPHFQVVILTNRDGAAGSSADQTLDKQLYPYFSRIHLPYDGWVQALTELSQVTAQHVVGGEGATKSASWTIILRHDSQLSEVALYWLAHSIVKASQLGVIYADHDSIDVDNRLSQPVFKPDWSPELLRATNYIGEAFAWRSRPLSPIWDVAQAATYSTAGALHSLLLALTADTPRVEHILAPIWHLNKEGQCNAISARTETRDVVAAHLQRQGLSASVEATGTGRCHVRYTLPEPRPLVTIVIPTRDGLAHLRCCIDSLLQKTLYPAYEIIVMDNQSVEPATLAYLRALTIRSNIRVLRFDEPFNYSRINNHAVEQARGEIVCLLNNDTEVISPDWLDEMVSLLMQDGVGAVGAKLLYGDDTVQHGGDTVGPGGCANHLHTGIGRDEPGYCGRALVSQELSAVTAACLLTHKSLYQSLGGLNEVHLTVAFNDVDFCLRVRDKGFRVVWTPHALLYHHESITRGKDTSPAQVLRARMEVEYMRMRWAHLMHHDPFYNPNLNYQHPDFSLSGTPHVALPWR